VASLRRGVKKLGLTQRRYDATIKTTMDDENLYKHHVAALRRGVKLLNLTQRRDDATRDT